MRFVAHTPEDVAEMLAAIGVRSIDDLFAGLPADVPHPPAFPWPERLSDPELLAHLGEVAARNVTLGSRPSFLGGGAYRHYIPPVVDALAGRGEFFSSYTPYQPEASQGTLQAAFEFQSLICELTALEVANASLYDGATALVEALLMVHAVKDPASRRPTLLVSRGVHPEYRRTVATYALNLGLTVVEIPLDGDGRTSALEVLRHAPAASALAFQSPTFHGLLEDPRALVAAAASAGLATVQVIDPHALALLAPPGETGVDVACGEGRSLGSPPAYGGPSLGLLACRAEYLRRLPGRVVGRTQDLAGRPAYTTTLQTREQHIRRERATSNICTNAQHMALRAAIYLSAMGKEGLREAARVSTLRAHHLADRVADVPGYGLRWPETPFFKEVAVRCPAPAREIGRALAARRITGGLDLGRFDPTLADVMLFCVTETTPPAHIDALVAALEEIR